MDCRRIIFSGHAIRQMFEREISRDDVHRVIADGRAIAEYPDDMPYPSQLLLGMAHDRPIHVVLAYDDQTHCGYVVTVYVADPELWSDDFTTRRDR